MENLQWNYEPWNTAPGRSPSWSVLCVGPSFSVYLEMQKEKATDARVPLEWGPLAISLVMLFID